MFNYLKNQVQILRMRVSVDGMDHIMHALSNLSSSLKRN